MGTLWTFSSYFYFLSELGDKVVILGWGRSYEKFEKRGEGMEWSSVRMR